MLVIQKEILFSVAQGKKSVNILGIITICVSGVVHVTIRNETPYHYNTSAIEDNLTRISYTYK